MLKYVLVIFALVFIVVAQPKFNNLIAKDIEETKGKISRCEMEISALKQEIAWVISNMDIKTYAKNNGLSFNVKSQIVLTLNEKNNKYKIQNEKPNLVEQILLSFTE